MKKILLTLLLSTISFFAFSTNYDTVEVVIENDTIYPKMAFIENKTVFIFTEEQARKIDTDNELLSLYKVMAEKSNGVDSTYIKVIDSKNQEIGKLEQSVKDLQKAIVAKDNEIVNLNKQLESWKKSAGEWDKKEKAYLVQQNKDKKTIKNLKSGLTWSVVGGLVLSVVVAIVVGT